MPSQNRAIVDKLLTNVSNMKKTQGHICELLLPELQVKQRTGKLAGYGQNHLRIVNSIKRGRGKYRQVEAVVRTQTSYEIEGHGLEGMVTREDYDNVEAPYDAEKDETDAITSILLQEKEYICSQALSDAAVLTQNTTLSGGDQFSDYNNSDPLGVALIARAAVRAGCGQVANAAWCDESVADVLRFHPQILDALGFKFARPGGLSDEELAKAFKVKKFYVAEAMYQSANEGQTAAALAPLWGKHFWFGVIPDAPAKGQTSLGYRLALSGQAPRKVRKWPINNPPDSTAVLVEDEYDFFITDVGAAYFIQNAIA